MDSGALKKTMAVATLATALVAGACSGSDGGPTTSVESSDPTEGSAAGGDPAEYCAALEAMLNSQPAGGFVGDGFGAAMTTYAEAIEHAADVAPAEQADSLHDLAAFVRDSSANPQDEGLADRAFGLIGPMLRVQNHAINECGLDPETVAGGSTEPPPPIRNDVEELNAQVLDVVNSLVPTGVDLAFESMRTIDDDEHPVLAAAPSGWDTRDFIGTTFEGGDDFGFFTKMDVGGHCDGLCAPRDWQTLMNDMEFGPFSGLADAVEVFRDESLDAPQGRIVVYREDTTITPLNIVVTRWDNRADRYFRCEVGLDEEDVDLWEAFAAACEAAIPLWIPVE